MGCSPISKTNKNEYIIKINKSEDNKNYNNNNNLNTLNSLINNSSKNSSKISKTNSIMSEINQKTSNEDFQEYNLILGHNFQSGSLSIKTEIFLQCKNLPNLNSFIKVYKNEEKNWIEIGKTEINKFSFNPSFIKTFIMNYHFDDNEKNQLLKFEINSIEKNRIINIDNCEVTLKDILSSKNLEYVIEFNNKKSKLIIKGYQKKNNSKFIQMKLGIHGVKSTMNKIFCIISKKNFHSEFIPIFITEEKEHNPTKKEKLFFWETIEFEDDRLEIGNLLSNFVDTNIIKFQIFDVDKKNKIKLLTECEITIEDLEIKKEFQLKKIFNDKLHFLVIDDIKKIEKFSLFSFLVSGMEYECHFFLDFTRTKFNLDVSNSFQNKFTIDYLKKNDNNNNDENFIYRSIKDLKKEDKEKFIGIENLKKDVIKKNDEILIKNDILLSNLYNYQKNLKSRNFRSNFLNLKTKKKSKKKIESSLKELNLLVEFIIKDQFELDSNNKCSIFGFGCSIPPDYDIECNNFSLNFDILNPEFEGYNEVYNSYVYGLKNFNLNGPVLISDSLNHLLFYIKNENFNDVTQKFIIGFFIVSGNIHDEEFLLNFLAENNNLAFSLIIISIGNEFNYEKFENDIENFFKEKNLRKNILYVNFNYYFKEYSNNIVKLEEKLKLLCKKIYNKLNDQFINFILNNKIKPFDSKNLMNKNTPDFINFRKKKMNQKYIIPKFLINLRDNLIEDVNKLNYNNFIFEKTFNNKIIPTFDKHFIINQLNKKREILMNFEENKQKIERKKSNKKFILWNDLALIDEREDFFYNKNNQNNEIQKIHVQNNVQNFSNKICNFCNENKINIVFQYCKHKFSCIYCLPKIKNFQCPICKKNINHFVQIFNN